MDKIDLTGQPPWLISIFIVTVGVIAPAILAWIGRRKGQQEDIRQNERVEVTTPWLVQNLLEIKMTVEATKHSIDALTAAMNAAAIQINNLASKRRDH
jgi:hypothetical protein